MRSNHIAYPNTKGGDFMNFKIEDHKPVNSASSLIGKFAIQIDEELIISDFTVHRRNGREWISFPARQFVKDDGRKGYRDYISFVGKSGNAEFKKRLLAKVSKTGGI